LQARRQRAGALWIVRRERSIVRLRHAGDDLQLSDSACIADVRLQNGRRALLQKSP
jgi:hypothetical protein